VAPAQLIFSFEHQQRTAMRYLLQTCRLLSGRRFRMASKLIAIAMLLGEFQLPTHFITVVGKYYGGSDLRFFLAGQLLSNFNDIAGLTSVATATSVDGSSAVAFGFDNGIAVVAPQRPVRAQGGFVQLGFPLSRLFDADPKGRNAGWTAFVYYGLIRRKRATPVGSVCVVDVVTCSRATFNTNGTSG
jgi:hypothetical protein